MRPGLPAQEGVDPPTAGDPAPDSGGIEGIEDTQHFGGLHGAVDQPPPGHIVMCW
jgi:hypothetical protein